MKTTLYSLLAAAACGMALGQTAYTTPVGYTTQTLAANTLNVVGNNVLTPTVAAGVLTNVVGTTLSASAFNFTTLLTPAKTYVLDITNGTAAGTVQEFVTWSGSDITLPAAITGIAIGDQFSLRVAPTLQEIFPIGLLAASLSATNADKVWVPNGLGGYTKYWLKSGTPVTWHTTVTGTSDTGLVSADIPLVYIDGLYVEKKGVAKDLVLSGQVKKTGSNTLLTTSLNLISVVPPVGLTLFTSGLLGDIAASLSATNADIVWVPNGLGGYTKYWLKSGTPVTWHTTVTGTSDTGLVTVDVNLPPSILIQRKGAAKVVSLDVPASYSGF